MALFNNQQSTISTINNQQSTINNQQSTINNQQQHYDHNQQLTTARAPTAPAAGAAAAGCWCLFILLRIPKYPRES
jgi:hypothetical protein